MKLPLNANYLQHCFPGYQLDWVVVHETLQLDLGHVQLLRDFSRQWPKQDPLLLLLLLALVDAVNRGSLCLLLDDPRLQQLANRQGMPRDVKAHLNGLMLNQLLLHGEPIIHLQAGRLYFVKYHQQEQELQANLLSLIQHSRVINHPQSAIKAQVSEVVDALPYVLEAQQIQAVLTAILQPFSIISGGPGTGKTTILMSLLKTMLRLGLSAAEVALAAPTGRAANRMTESLRSGFKLQEQDQSMAEIEATTIHRLLGVHPQKPHPRYHHHNHLPFRLIVIDEVSMVDLMLMNHLIRAISLDTRLVFLGDQFQLPSVHSGAMLADLMPPVHTVGLNTAAFISQLKNLWPPGHVMPACHALAETAQLMTDKVTVLKVSKRCQPEIAQLSEAVRQGDVERFFSAPIEALDTKQLSFVQRPINWVHASTGDYAAWSQVLQAWLQQHFLDPNDQGHNYPGLLANLWHVPAHELSQGSPDLQATFALIAAQRILTFMNQGHRGADLINKQWSVWLRKQLQVGGSERVFHGAVIMVLRNDRGLGLFNGDVGVVLETAPEQFSVVFQQGTGYQVYSVHVIPQFSLAFAMTVHKSQGSEFQHVLMPLPEQITHRLLSREIIYTGMTRAKQTVCFYGSEAVMKAGIQRRTKRHSGLAFWYNDANV